eukprot:CAMPEP_0195104622 /NCGR_PEP_ID=MMETSP0448-20130528/73203_1 /TAXON_ID=66468 /ORGANISM="Heterocapsa triquestra, Strain CCMP 448" /LENGTH=642 /DNA_ID=CAMNT_0040140493 /DNA_START=101 /DNA_END=2029 /DNA_ORIENTATION=+
MAGLGRVLLLTALGPLSAQAERIFINTTALPFQVTSSQSGVLGRSGTIRGAGGWGYLDVAASSGADAMRVWDINVLNETLPAAEEAGLTVSVGIWLDHDPHRYENCSDLDNDPYWNGELARWLSSVRRHKDSPAVLWWTVGNEIEMEVNIEEGSECLWRRLEWVVQAVQAEDPNHPVGTVTAGVHEMKVRGLARWTPSLDFLGVNSYGDASLRVGNQLMEWNWTKPYALLEYGPTGHWEALLTTWGSYVEETSSEKVPRYNATCYGCQEDPRCIGAFAFVWGWKWEKTGTWYGMFNEWGEVTEGVAANCTDCESEVLPVLQQCWTGSPRAIMPPSIQAININGSNLSYMAFSADTDMDLSLTVEISNPSNSTVTAVWAVTEEIVSNAIGGAPEDTNPLLTDRFPQDAESSTGSGLSTTLSTKGLPVGGKYRLYVFVRSDPTACTEGNCPNHEAYASMAFEVCHTARPGEQCFDNIQYAKDRIKRRDNGYGDCINLYPGVHATSSDRNFQAMLHQLGGHGCPMPCAAEGATPFGWCHNALPDTECYTRIEWVRRDGIRLSPSLYSGLNEDSSAEQIQMHLFNLNSSGVCPRPCSTRLAFIASTTTTEEPEELTSGGRPIASCRGSLAIILLAAALVGMQRAEQ